MTRLSELSETNPTDEGVDDPEPEPACEIGSILGLAFVDEFPEGISILLDLGGEFSTTSLLFPGSSPWGRRILGAASEGDTVILGVLPCLLGPFEPGISSFKPPFGSAKLGEGSPVGLIGDGGYGYDVGEVGIGGSRWGEVGV